MRPVAARSGPHRWSRAGRRGEGRGIRKEPGGDGGYGPTAASRVRVHRCHLTRRTLVRAACAAAPPRRPMPRRPPPHPPMPRPMPRRPCGAGSGELRRAAAGPRGHRLRPPPRSNPPRAPGRRAGRPAPRCPAAALGAGHSPIIWVTNAAGASCVVTERPTGESRISPTVMTAKPPKSHSGLHLPGCTAGTTSITYESPAGTSPRPNLTGTEGARGAARTHSTAKSGLSTIRTNEPATADVGGVRGVRRARGRSRRSGSAAGKAAASAAARRSPTCLRTGRR